MKKGLFGSLKVLLTDLSHSVTSRKGPALVAVVAADALLGPFLRPEGQFLVVRLKKISHLSVYDCFAYIITKYLCYFTISIMLDAEGCGPVKFKGNLDRKLPSKI